ncbi:FecR family protein [Puteibacter caeruleilacunae]|nr:FecR family protein [Puteibacter caeruleilacunae]
MKKNISSILARILIGEASRDDNQEFSYWIGASSANEHSFNKIKELWQLNFRQKKIETTPDIRTALSFRLNAVKEASVSVPRIFHLWRIAAVLFFVMSIATGVLLYVEGNKTWQSMTVSTEAGQRTMTVLPDGSKVWLNGNTSLVLAEGSSRVVKLDGEAFFDVTHDKRHPFIVETSDYKVKVLGTKFNVCTYAKDDVLRTTLVEGAVELIDKDDRSLLLKPGYEASLIRNGKQFKLKKIDLTEVTGWREGKLIFKSTPFKEFVKRLEHWYGVEFSYNENDFQNIHYTGTMDNLRLENLMEYLSLTLSIDYKIDNNNVILTKRED